MTGFEKYLINDTRFERERDVVWSKDKDFSHKGNMREGYLTKLFTADRWGHTRDGVKEFMATDWITKLGDTFDALHEHYYKPTGDDDYHLDLPKDYDELERVARLFRETYIAYFVYFCMRDVEEGYEPTAWHYMADALEECYFCADAYDDVIKAYAANDKEKQIEALWHAFFDRVYGRSRKFNITNYVYANSVLTMLENLYWEKFERGKSHNTVDYEAEAKKEEEEYKKTAQEVEDIING